MLQRWKYTLNIMMDGNFQGEHMKMRAPNGDVALSDGKGFFVEDEPYKAHLKVAHGPVEVSNKVASIALPSNIVIWHAFAAINMQCS